MKAPMKFELIAGTHSNNDGHFKVGDIVTAFSDLTVAYENKFKRRVDLEVPGAVQPAPKPVIEPKKKPAPVVETEDEGEEDASEEGEHTPPANAPAAPAATGSKKEIPAEFGDEVTAQFPKAKDADFRVYKNASGYHVIDPDEPTKALNPKPLKKGAVAEFIGGFLK